jgi:hypothetical protein
MLGIEDEEKEEEEEEEQEQEESLFQAHAIEDVDLRPGG